MENDWSLRVILTFVVHVVAVIAVAWFLVWGVGKSQVIYGQSMEPTLNIDDTVIIDRLTYKIRDPKRYEVIAFYNEQVDAIDIDDLEANEVVPEISIKRIIGLPGETVQIVDGRVHINGKELTDNNKYIVVPLPGIAERPIKLGPSEYFVLGDNSKVSEDSRYEKIGNINKNRILGRVWYKTKPVNEMGKVK